jgi:hypothetical protein
VSLSLSITGTLALILCAPALLSGIIFFTLTVAAAFSRRFNWLQQRSESCLIWTSLPFGGLFFFTVCLCNVLVLAYRSLTKWVARLYVRQIRRKVTSRGPTVHGSLLPLHRLRRRSTPPFRLLDLPPELRHRFYAFAASTDGGLDCTPTRLLRPNQSFRSAVALLRTCRRIRHEAAALFYRSIFFHAYTRYPFYRNIDTGMLSHIRELNLVTHCNSRGFSGLYSILRYDLPRMKELRDLYITLVYADFLKWQRLIAGAFGHLKQELPHLSFVSLLVNAGNSANNDPGIRASLSACLDEARPAWPRTSSKKLDSEVLEGSKHTVWHASLRLMRYYPASHRRDSTPYIFRRI